MTILLEQDFHLENLYEKTRRKVKRQLSMVLLVGRLVGMETWPQYVLSSVVLPDEFFFLI